MKGLRGFIGPLGDDIPSIFPIVAGILIFLTSMLYIDSQFSERNAYLETRSATLQLSYVATDKGYMDDAKFIEKCTEMNLFAQKKQLKFATILKKYCGPMVFSDSENLKITSSQKTFGTVTSIVEDKVCSSDETISKVTPNPPISAQAISIPSKNAILLSYPIAVDCGNSNRGLGLITIAGWRGA
ncbi:hypothetical protein HY989_01245 [Candidatus Micrarchaeota archaeon]|nr:hypothetical protein [Candidatus Micrarchaeota archaeon]